MLSTLEGFNCSIIEKGLKSVSFIERFFLLCSLFGVSFIRGSTGYHTHGNEEVKKVDIEAGPPDIGQSVAESLERTDPKPIRRSQLRVLGFGRFFLN